MGKIENNVCLEVLQEDNIKNDTFYITHKVGNNKTQKVKVNYEQYISWYRFINLHRKRAQRNGKCLCPKDKLIYCDIVCDECIYCSKFKVDSLDIPQFLDDRDSESKINRIIDNTTNNLVKEITLKVSIEELINELKENEPDLFLIISTMYQEIKEKNLQLYQIYVKDLIYLHLLFMTGSQK